jgi:neutral ceramidase
MPLYAGVCETNITPPTGVWMCGYAFRPTGCVGVHDELHARALVLNNGHTAIVIVTMDLLGLDFDLVEAVRKGVSEQTGIAPEALMLNATHTHGGPNVGKLNAMGERDPAYIDVLTRKLIGIIRQASDRMQPVSLAYGQADVQIGINRRQYPKGEGQTFIGRNFAGPVDSQVRALSVQDSRGRPFALLFSHACHPTTVGGDNLQITADFPGVACDYVRLESDGRVMPFFLQGCCGNINPEPRGSFMHVEQHGLNLGLAAVEALEGANPLDSDELSFTEKTISLPLIAPPPLEECEKNIREWTEKVAQDRASGHIGHILHSEGLRNYYKQEREIAAWPNPTLDKPFALQRLTVGGAQFLGMPGEMFVQYGLDFELQAEGPVFALGYTNGVHGYVPIAADYPHGGYEVDGAYRYYGTLMYTPECEPLIRGAAYELLGVHSPDNRPYSISADGPEEPPVLQRPRLI